MRPRKAVRGEAREKEKGGEGSKGPQGRSQQGGRRNWAVKGEGQQWTLYLGTARPLVH